MSKRPRVYDKAKYHWGNHWPEGLSDDQAFVHTGLFLGWLIDRCLVSDSFQKDLASCIGEFTRRELTGPGVYAHCDGALIDDMLSTAGNDFAGAYFDVQSGRYFADYEQLLCADLPTIYHVGDTWENYDKLKVMLDRRYDEWLASRRGRRGPSTR